MKIRQISIGVLLISLIVSFIHCSKEGCKDTEALNYNSKAKKSNGTCEYKAGCTDPKSIYYCEDCKVDDGSCKYLKIGDSLGGGTIFYIDASGLHGLIAAPKDLNPAIWGEIMTTNATGGIIGTGKLNTSLITAAQGSLSSAASICEKLVLNGYDDWFLPSADELRLMYTQKGQGILDGFSGNNYWSSTERDVYSAWVIFNRSKTTYSIGFQPYFKGDIAYVRAIRTF